MARTINLIYSTFLRVRSARYSFDDFDQLRKVGASWNLRFSGPAKQVTFFGYGSGQNLRETGGQIASICGLKYEIDKGWEEARSSD